MERRSLVFWPGNNGQDHLKQIDPRVVSAIAIRLANAPFVAEMIADARKEGLGVYLDGEAWRNQFPPEDGNRTNRFQMMPYCFGVDVLDPESTAFSAEAIVEYATSYLLWQDRHHGTILATPGHIGRSSTGQARQLDLRLAEAAIRIFNELGLRQPDPATPTGSESSLFATISLNARTMQGEECAVLVDMYAHLDVDGFIVNIFNFEDGKGSYATVRELTMALQAASGKPVILSGAGHLWQASLAGGLAAVVAGPERMKLTYATQPFEEGSDDEEKGAPFGVCLYRREILGMIELGKKGDLKIARSFKRWPCKCGFHEPDAEKLSKPERLRHNVHALMRDARTAVSGDHRAATKRLAHRIETVRRNRKKLGVAELPAAWSVVSDPAANSRKRRSA